MKPKFGISVLLLATLFIAAISCTVKNPEVTNTEKFDIRVSQIASSTTGTTISWIDDKGDNKNYTVKVYTDNGCTNLYEEYILVFGEQDDKRFSVPYLDTTRKYYICVENVLGYKSKPLEVELANTFVRGEIISQNFDKLFWGYDYINSANSVILADEINPKTYSIDSFADAIADSQPTTSVDDYGGPLFTYKESMRNLMGFEGWPKGDDVHILPGCVKLGSARAIGVLRTPDFSSLGSETAAIDISFSAAIYATNLQANGGKVTLNIVKGDGTTLATKDFSLKGINGKPEWAPFSWKNIGGVTSDCHCEIKTNDQTRQVCIDNLKIVHHLNVPEGNIYGYTYDKTSGKPIAGVAISDGYTVVATDASGFYTMKPSTDTWHIYYSVPANCKVKTFQHGPKFYERYKKDIQEYSFELELLPNGKPEEKFALLTFADPQVSSSTGLNRFTGEAIPAIKAFVKASDIPCYGITLGDVISTSSTDADHNGTATRGDATPYMEKMREAMRPNTVGFPIFQVMGNHDCNYFGASCPLEPDATSSNYQLKAQREFESTFGPINYSFNRGDVHIIGMRDIYYDKNTTTRNYSTGFLKSQYEWLKQDLALVPKDKMVVLCVHIPLFSKISNSGESGHYVKEVHQLLNQYKEAHIISGHTHYQRNYIHTSYDIYEHNMGTVCGTWWSSNVCGDGTPNGYGVFVGEGNTFSDWYYMGYHEGMNTRDDQLRLYRGNAITGAARPSSAKTSDGTGYYSFNFAEDVIIANVFNADDNWTIEVYEDGVKTGEMKRITNSSTSFDKLVGTYTMDDPRRIKDGTIAPYDMWTVGIQVGELNRVGSNGSWVYCYHLYQYTLKNADAKVEVVAIDPFGNRYSSDKFVDYRDNKMGKKP
ncbi:MAG: calcineurin-like phosphoesterase family protein [Alistipes sp.]|nr:calcineurin-like phosphoesterase family protein [Alistipes sp.]